MDIEKKIIFKKNSIDCEFASISEKDVTEKYVKGLQKQTRFISNIPSNITIEKQREYVRGIRVSKSNCIFGLFVNGQLIGTSGAQNVLNSDLTTMGILIFNENVRGFGYGKTLVWCSCCLLNEVIGCSQFFARMKKENIPSFKSFAACGFKISTEEEDVYYMKIDAKELVTPGYISNIEIVLKQ